MMMIRKISETEKSSAMQLVWDVFQEFEAPDYSPEGSKTFKDFIYGPMLNTVAEVYGAFENDTLLGVIATRNEGNHIALFFVRKEYHGQGIGRKLFDHIVPLGNNNCITVNSSPYAAEIYRKLGFIDQDAEQLTNGIRYIPMKYTKKQNK